MVHNNPVGVLKDLNLKIKRLENLAPLYEELLESKLIGQAEGSNKIEIRA